MQAKSKFESSQLAAMEYPNASAEFNDSIEFEEEEEEEEGGHNPHQSMTSYSASSSSRKEPLEFSRSPHHLHSPSTPSQPSQASRLGPKSPRVLLDLVPVESILGFDEEKDSDALSGSPVYYTVEEDEDEGDSDN